MIVKVLRISDKEEFQEWNDLIKSLSCSDIFFYPNYSQVYALNNEGEAYCFLCKNNDEDFIAYPFLKRRINQLEFFRDISDEYYDIISPYGYGGYLRSKKCTISINDFYESLHNYCIENNIISEFVRFHPWLKTERGCENLLNLKVHNKVVSVDVTKSSDDIWMDLDGKCKNRIRKSTRYGVTVKEENGASSIDNFYRLYIRTMDRNRASRYYYFDKQFFYNMLEKLAGNITFFNAYIEDNITASVLVLYNKMFVHAHLAGTDRKYFHLSPIMSIFYEISLWANDRGSQYFIIGGGRTSRPNDCLYRLKRRFSRESYNYSIGTKIHNNKVYELLCSKKLEYENSNGINNVNNLNDSDFFPAYRNNN